MNKLCSVILLLALAATTSSWLHGQSAANARNGFWWESISSEAKLSYVAGYADGACAASATWQAFNSMGNQKMSPVRSNLATGAEDFSQIRFGQYQAGVDTFNQDFRNKSIHVQDVMPYVKDQIKGLDQKQLNSELEGLRKLATTAGYDN